MRRLALAAVLLCACAAAPTSARDVPGFGSVAFPTSCSPGVQDRIDTAVARLHSFDGPEEAFRAIARADPGCAIAWWGAAMAVRGNPLAGEADGAALKAGQAYIAEALAAHPKTDREAGLINALGIYYRDPAEDQAERTRAYEAAMKGVAARNPGDVDIQAFYALAILEAVDLADTTYARQRAAGAILEGLRAAYPNHPGAAHYLIHAYDYAPLAAGALEAARQYPHIAPASPHAQHMPAHIYSMLGLWQDSIAANHAAAALEDPGHHSTAILDSVDPHGMDFIAYARLQLAQDDEVVAALRQAGPSEERTLVAARYLLERGDWDGASEMPVRVTSSLDRMTVRFVRAIGAARAGRPAQARIDAEALRALRGPVLRTEGAYWAGLVNVYADAADAWIAQAEHHPGAALAKMRAAADADDGRAKHILLENRLVPMREVYGELLLILGRPADALAAFRMSLKAQPNRFRSNLGIARADRALGRDADARAAYSALQELASSARPGRSELDEARAYMSVRR